MSGAVSREPHLLAGTLLGLPLRLVLKGHHLGLPRPGNLLLLSPDRFELLQISLLVGGRFQHGANLHLLIISLADADGVGGELVLAEALLGLATSEEASRAERGRRGELGGARLAQENLEMRRLGR